VTKTELKQQIIETGVVAVIRAKDSAQLLQVSEAIEAGGVNLVEVTMTTPDALGVIAEVAGNLGDRVAGARFVVGPTLNHDVIRVCNRYGKLVVPGAFTPTEILSAWESGADFVKIFPAGGFGPRYIKDIKGPLPQVEVIPTGGVNAENAGDFIKAGAAAVAAGSSLVSKEALASGNLADITENAKKFVQAVKAARES